MATVGAKRSPLTIAILAGKAKEAKDGDGHAEPDGDEPDGDEEDDGSMGKESAAEDVMAAIKKGDSKALVEALESFVEQCKDSY